jgi:hypothetical protein
LALLSCALPSGAEDLVLVARLSPQKGLV